MARLSFTLDIAAPPNRVAAFFVPQRMPYWYGAEMELHLEVQGGAPDFQSGQKVRISGSLQGREVSHVAVVTRYEPGRALEWRFHDAYGVKGMQRWENEPVAGGTRVRMTDEYELPGRFGRIADALFMRFSVAARDRAWLRKLKQLAERA